MVQYWYHITKWAYKYERLYTHKYYYLLLSSSRLFDVYTKLSVNCVQNFHITEAKSYYFSYEFDHFPPRLLQVVLW